MKIIINRKKIQSALQYVDCWNYTIFHSILHKKMNIWWIINKCMMFYKIKNKLQRTIVVIDKKYISNKYYIEKNYLCIFEIIRILNKRKIKTFFFYFMYGYYSLMHFSILFHGNYIQWQWHKYVKKNNSVNIINNLNLFLQKNLL